VIKTFGDFFRRWPSLAVFGTLLGAPMLVLAAAGGVEELAGGDASVILCCAAVGIFIALMAWGGVLAPSGGEEKTDRSFPLCFATWLIRPPFKGEAPAVEKWDPQGDPRFAPLYLIALLPLAFLRWLQCARDRTPLNGDLISIHAPWPDPDFLLAEVTRNDGLVKTIRPLARFDRRPRAVRLEAVALRPEPEIELRNARYEMLKPRLLWRDDREFYVREHYSAIEQAGKNVEKLEALAREEAERAKLTA
jgi:hypothetical protein